LGASFGHLRERQALAFAEAPGGWHIVVGDTQNARIACPAFPGDQADVQANAAAAVHGRPREQITRRLTGLLTAHLDSRKPIFQSRSTAH
jgi:hypothetical protein